MVASTDSIRYAVVRETTPSVTPATPAYDVMRLTSESVALETDQAISQELNPARGPASVRRVNSRNAGPINGMMVANSLYEDFMESVLGGAWSAAFPADGFVVPANNLHTYTLEKRIQLEDLSYHYHRYAGLTISSMELTIPANGELSVSFGTRGGVLTVDTAEIAGSTYGSAAPQVDLAPTMLAKDASIGWTGELSSIAGECVQNMVITFDTNNEGIGCIGTDGEKESFLGALRASITAEVLFLSAGSMDAFLNQNLSDVLVGIADTTPSTDNHAYDIAVSNLVVTGNRVEGPGTSQAVLAQMTLEGARPAPMVRIDRYTS